MATTNISLRSDSTDLGALWTKAVNDYVQKTGNKVEQMRAQDLNAVIRATNDQMKAFGGFRHGGGKMDRVRSAFQRCLGDMQICMQGLEKVGAAAGAFPPAMPVGLVFSACGHLLSSFASASAQYDMVEEFFNHSRRFYERLSILQGQVNVEALALAIVRVFSTQLSICGVAQRMATSGRTKYFFKILWNMEDPELSAAYAAMQQSIEELGATVGYASYSTICDTHHDVAKVDAKLDELDAHIQTFRSTLREDVQALYASNLDLDIKVTEGFVSMQAKQEQSYDMQVYLSQKQDLLLEAIKSSQYNAFQDQSLEAMKRNNMAQVESTQTKGDVGDGRIRALADVRSHFDENQARYPAFGEAIQNNLDEHERIRKTTIESSATWLVEHPDFEKWRNGLHQFISLSGSDGVGKTHLANAAYHDMAARVSSTSALGYFYFTPKFTIVDTAVACVVMQIATLDERYAEETATELREEVSKPSNNRGNTSMWERFLTSRFPKTNQSKHLFLFIDGVDELPKDQTQALLEFSQAIHNKNAKISLFVTSKDSKVSIFDSMPSVNIAITKDKINAALASLVRARIDALPRIKKFSRVVKKAIAKRLVRHADSMLYAEHMLRRLSSIGRESAVLRALENMPGSLPELFDLLLRECGKGRTDTQFAILKTLFIWLTFAKRTLTLSEGSTLVTFSARPSEDRSSLETTKAMWNASLLRNDDEAIDIEDEVIGRSSRVLEVTHKKTIEDVEANLDESPDDDDDDTEAVDDQEDPKLVAYRAAELTFQDSALHRYFHNFDQSVSVPETERSFRVSAPDGHFHIFAACVELMIGVGETQPYRASSVTGLQRYALSCWMAHFQELDVTQASDQLIARVVQVLHRLSVGADAFAMALLRQGPQLAGGLPERKIGATHWYDRVTAWARRALSLPAGSISDPVQRWANGPWEELVLLPLARGSAKAWPYETRQWGFVYSYWFVRQFVKLSYRTDLTYEGSDLLAETTHYANLFTNTVPESLKLKAIAVSYFVEHWKFEGSNDTLQVETTLELMERSAGMASNPVEKTMTLYLLGIFYAMLKREEDAITLFRKTYDEAEKMDLDSLPENVQEEAKLIQELNLDRLANTVKKAGDFQEALKLFETQKALKSFKFRQTVHLSILGLTVKLDPSGHQAMNTLTSWPRIDRSTYFDYPFQYRALGRGEFVDFTKPARRTGQVGALLQMLHEEEVLKRKETLKVMNLKNAIAKIYLEVLRDAQKAKSIKLEILQMQPDTGERRGWDTEAFRKTQNVEWRRYAALIFSQFQNTPDVTTKEALLEELKNIPRLQFQKSDELKESHVGMLKAYMLRILGPTSEYQRCMNDLFNVCTAALEDGVSYNDSASLRLLTKVLSSLDGLERDARISYAAQFSILDRELQHGQTEDSEKEEKVWDGDEDLTNTTLPCDGCGRKQSRWDSPQYMCLVCPVLDLCESCYAKEKESHARIPSATNPDENGVWEDELWQTRCDSTHVYIKGPIKGWKGVRGGVMRIGEEEAQVKEWLKGLKETRWKAAWERFWRSRSALRDIADDDSEIDKVE